MRKQHILYTGYPKCGTTWCWKMIKQQSWFTTSNRIGYWEDKEDNSLITGNTITEYVKSYSHGDITGNFSPANFALDRMMIAQLSQVDNLQAGIIFRNPFELYWSLYNFYSNKNGRSFNDETRVLIEQGWFNRMDLIVTRWTNIFSLEKFKIFFYDDLQEDSTLFFVNFCRAFNLPSPEFKETSIENKTIYSDEQPVFDIDLINLINDDISRLEDVVQRDLSGWKRYKD